VPKDSPLRSPWFLEKKIIENSPSVNPKFSPNWRPLPDVVKSLRINRDTQKLALALVGLSVAVKAAQHYGIRVLLIPFRILFLMPTILIEQEIMNLSPHAGKYTQSSLMMKDIGEGVVLCVETHNKEMNCIIPDPSDSKARLGIAFKNTLGEVYVCNKGDDE
jgi:hypothetical protein